MKPLPIVYTCALLISLQSCKGQANSLTAPKETKNTITLRDSLNKPGVNVKVNKQFDSRGNLIRYDSTYTYLYKGGTGTINDSLFPLNNFSGTHSLELFDRMNRDNFFNDSLFKSKFFEDDFFKKQSELNRLFFDGFYPKTDTLKKQQITYPYLRPGSKTI